MENRSLEFHCMVECAILALILHFTHFPFTLVLGNFGDESLKATAESVHWRMSWPGLNACRQQTAPC